MSHTNSDAIMTDAGFDGSATSYAATLRPDARSASWVIETWMTDEPTLRWLIGRFTSRRDLYAAYLHILSTVDDTARLTFPQDMPGYYTPDQYRLRDPGGPTIHRGPKAGTLAIAGPLVFQEAATAYLLPSVTRGQRGWRGIAAWRANPIYRDRAERETVTPMRDRSVVRPGDVPMWMRTD